MAGPGNSRPASERYSQKRLEKLLADAELNASRDWDCKFITDMQSRYKTFGMGMHITTLQQHQLERIAHLNANERARNGTD